MVGFLRAIERRLSLIGYVFRAKFGRLGDLIPWPNRDGRAELDHQSRPKKSTIPQSIVGGLHMFRELVLEWKGGYVCGDGNLGEYSTLGGGGRNGQLVTGRPISMIPPASTPEEHHNQHCLGWVGAESPREWRIGCILLCAFFGIMACGGGFKVLLNCDRVNEFDRSARSLASKI